MHLHEEYIKRHKLKLPLIRYDSKSAVILRSKEEPVFWRIIDITWTPCHWHPGKFIIKTLAPHHDNPRMVRIFPTKEIYWDQYEDQVLALRDLRLDFCAVTKTESPLAAWYVFLLMYDTYLVTLSDQFKELVAGSVNSDSEMTARRFAAQKAQLLMCSENVGLQDAYGAYMVTYRNYADWLVDLIND